MRRLRIALLSRWLWEENRRTGTVAGGPVQQLAEAVAALGHEVVALSQSPEAAGLEPGRIGGLEAWLAPRDRRRDAWTALRDKIAKRAYGHRKVHTDALDLRDFLRRRGPFDVLWAQGEEPDGLVAAVAARRGVALPPVLVQIYALRYRFRGGEPIFTEQKALGAAFRQAARIVANSELVAARLPAYAGSGLAAADLAARTVVLPHNLSREFLQAAEAGAAAAEPEPGRVLFFGALNEKKGALVFLDAVLRLAPQIPEAVFAVAGGFTGRDRAFRRAWEERLQKARAAAPGRIELLGKIAPGETIRQIARARVVALPSLFDEFSRALVEVLVLGRPVVTTSGVGASPLVTASGAGLVVPPGDAAALAEAVAEALRPDAPFATRARREAPRLRHEFSPEAVAACLARHLEEIAA